MSKGSDWFLSSGTSIFEDVDFEEELDKLLEELEVKCECGSERVYGEDAVHSDWCPKYEKK